MKPQNFVTVKTEYGPVKGIRKVSALGRDYLNFQGIPYMKAPVGKLRFRDAQPPEPWIEPLDATQEPSPYVHFNYFQNSVSGKEDSSIINVYTHDVSPSVLQPVMVWIHGGGFMTGSSCTDFYGPDYLLQKDVIVVSFNYRCGVFGFLTLDDPTLGIPGNAGLKDQTFALKWVQRNIQSFGGDPNNVTLFGESAGGASVHYHMIAEASRGLFQKAIPMSGVALNRTWTCIPRKNWAERVAKSLGYEGDLTDKEILEFLEGREPTDFMECLFKTTTDVETFGEHICLAFLPCVEPYETTTCFIPRDPVLMARNAWSDSIPCMVGGTSFEGLLRANFMPDVGAKILQNFNYFAPLYELGLSVDSEKAKEYGKRIKEVYYGLLKPSAANQEPYLHYMSDNMFWHGIQRVIQSRVNSGQSKTFFYRFDCTTEQNYGKKFVKAEEFEGTSHGDDLNYMWKHNGGLDIAHPRIDSIEMKMIMTLIGVLTSFAITSDPNCAAISETNWEPVISAHHPLTCLNISEKEIKMIPLPETERLRVWDSVYNDEGVALY